MAEGGEEEESWWEGIQLRIFAIEIVEQSVMKESELEVEDDGTTLTFYCLHSTPYRPSNSLFPFPPSLAPFSYRF